MTVTVPPPPPPDDEIRPVSAGYRRKSPVPVPVDAFAQYVAMGPSRSLSALAERIGCTTRALEYRSSDERWGDKLRAIEAATAKHVETVFAETTERMTARHISALHEVQAKALQALRDLPINNAAEAARVLDAAIKLERLARGEASERVAVDVATLLREQHKRWLAAEPEPVTLDAAPFEPSRLIEARPSEEPPPPPGEFDPDAPPPPTDEDAP